jgi:hypothetical protein
MLTIELIASSTFKKVYYIDNYDRIDADFDKVQLLLHFEDSVDAKEFKDAKGHYPIGIKTTSVTQGVFGDGRESVVFLDGSDYGGIEISPNNARNEPSSFNLYQDIADITRSSNVDWCFECFIGSEYATSESSFLQNRYLVSNSYSENGGGIDWGIRLEPTKIVVVIGDIDYSFDIPTGYIFSKWEYIRAYREDGTIGVWLNDNYLGWYENVPTHEKRCKNYFRIGRATEKESLHALLDEVRFSIGTARPEQIGLVPTKSFPNIGDFEHRPKITLNSLATFDKLPPNFVGLSLTIPKQKIQIGLQVQQNAISSFIKQPEINISIAKQYGFDIYFELKNPVNFPLSVTQQGLDLAFSIPSPIASISLIKEIEGDIFGSIPAPKIDVLMKVVPDISIIVTLPDLVTPVGTTSKIDAPIALPCLTTSLSMSSISGNNSDIFLTIPKPAFSLSISPYDATILDIFVAVPLPNVHLTVSPPIEIFGQIKSPKIFIGITPPPIDMLAWFDSLVDITVINVENQIYAKLPNLTTRMNINRNNELAIKIVAPKLKASLAMKLENNSPNQITIPVTLPALEIDISHRVMNLSLSVKQPVIHIQSLTASAFL